MAFLIDIGTGLVGKLVDYTVGAIGRQVGYLIFYNTNVKSLQDKLSELVAENERVEQILRTEERNLKERDDPVTNWLTDIKNKTGEVNDILDKRYKEKLMPLCGVFPNLVVRHQISRKSTKLVSDVAALYEKRKDFESYAHDINPQDVPSKDYEAFSSRTKLVDDIMDYLRNNPDDNLIGVFGLGGIGKTTLVKEVARQATQDKTMFNDVALVLDVKQDPGNIQRIQKEIAEKLGLEFPENETPAGRARRIFTRIKDKKTLVILDDVWGRIDLEAVGISGVATCKVLLTSRSRKVLSVDMQTQKEFPLDILKIEEAWNLFKKKAGDVVEVPSIKAVATEVAKKCGGLPVLVVTVASALRNKSNLHAWNDALRRLKLFGKEEETEKVYLTLEWSYSQLKDEELKQVFLLCGLFADSLKTICISYVFKYGIGLGLFKNHKTLGEAWAAVNTLVDQLKDSCLLLDHEDEGCLKMHDVVYDVANRISSRDNHMLKILDGDEFREWPDNKDFYDKCTMISLRTSNIPKLPQVLPCKELKFFCMNTRYHSLDIPRDFFKETRKLCVLHLTALRMPSLPSSIQFLTNLKTLCLVGCFLGDIALIGQLQQLEVLSFLNSIFKKLPKEVGQLTNLRSLDLTCFYELEQIAPGVISNLKMLEELKMGNSFNKWEADGEGIINNEKSNASLSELKCLSKLSILQIHILDANILPRDLFSSALERFQIYIGADWKWNRVDENVNILKIKLTTTAQVYRSGIKMLLKRTNELHLDGMEGCSNAAHQLDGDEFQQLKYLHVHNAEYRNIINGKDVLSNLQKLVVSGLENSKFFLSASEARRLVQLTHLQISECQTMEGIVSMNESDENHMRDIFSKLQHLELKDLPSLTKFFSRIDTGYQSLEILQPDNNEIVEVMKSGADIQNSFFNEKVVFPSMKTLIINGLTKLITVWHHQHSPESFKSIEKVKISGCPSLETVFPISMVASLKNLLHLKVKECGVEQIIADGIQTPYEFVFPKVISFQLRSLPNLKGFYNKMHVSLWPSLQELYVYDCSKVAFLAKECSSLQRNYESRNPAPTNQALFSIRKDVFSNLQKLVVSGLENSKFFLSAAEASRLVQVTHLQISNCPTMEGIVSTNESGKNHMMDIFSKLQHLELKDLPRLNKFCSRIDTRFQSLEQPDNNEIVEVMKSGADIQNSFFNEKVVFPSMKTLIINGLTKLITVWHHQHSPESFKSIETVDISRCPSFETVFPISMVTSLKNLLHLEVTRCGVEQIIADGIQAPYEFVFPKVISFQLMSLPNLNGFYNKMHVSLWPSLQKLYVDDCSKVAFLAQECSSLQRNYESRNPAPTNQTLFSIRKDSFPNLKSVTMYGMEIMDSDFPSIYFTNLEYFKFGSSDAESAAIFDNSTGLRNYGETSAPAPSEIYSHAERRIDEIPSVGTLTHLSRLVLFRLPCLMHLGNDSSQGIAGPNIPNLKYLRINGCDSLRNLRSSAVSFKNLTELEVINCSGLEYLITFSTAKRLNQLTKLFVENCARLVEIVRITEDDENAENEIVFSQLKYLRLSNLPGLQSFCSRDCTVEFPSLDKLWSSKRLKSKIFHHDETLQQVTKEYEYIDIDEDDAEAGVQADDGEKVIKEDVDLVANVGGEQSDITTNIITEQDNVQPLQITATDQDVIAPIEENLTILPVAQVTTHVFPAIEPSLVTQVTHNDELLVEEFFSDIESLAEEAILSNLRETPGPSAPVQHIKEQSDPSEPSSVATRSSMKSFGEKWSLVVVLFAVLLGICITLISLPHLRPGSRICTSVPLCHVINPFFHHLTSHQKHVHEPLEVDTNRGLITPVEENLAVALEGQKKITRVLLDIEHPPVAEVPQTEASRPDDEKQIDLYETSASTSSRKSFETKRSLREKLQAMSAKRTSSSSGPYKEAKSKLKALIATADLKDYHTRQQLLEILPALQISTTKWIADLAVQELAKLQLVMDKKQSLSAELAAHISQGSELDMRSQKLLSEGSKAEQNIHKVEEHKAELLALREQIKKLEAQATSLEDEITVLENKHFGFEASVDELDEEHQVNQGYVESTSQELLRTQAESASLSTAIFTYLRQLL